MDSRPGYRVEGEGHEVFSRVQIRDRIRAGEITNSTQLALENTQDYRPASAYPELARYLSLVGGGALAAPAAAMVMPSTEPAAPLSSRLGPGLVYPFTGVGPVVLLIVSGLQLVPVAGWLASAFVKVYQLAVIRTSANGSTTMPPVAEVGEAINAIITFLKVIVVGICSVWPVVAVVVFPFGGSGLFFAAALFTIAYAPASFAVLAKTDSIGEAINPSNVVGLMTTLGGDYAVAFMALVLFLAAAFAVSYFSAFVLHEVPGRLYIVLGVRGLLTEWGFFYFAHLVGWAIYRRT